MRIGTQPWTAVLVQRRPQAVDNRPAAFTTSRPNWLIEQKSSVHSYHLHWPFNVDVNQSLRFEQAVASLLQGVRFDVDVFIAS